MSNRDEQGYYKPTKTFKMPKTFKRMAAAIGDKELRDHWNRMCIQATMQSLDRPVKEKKNGRNQES